LKELTFDDREGRGEKELADVEGKRGFVMYLKKVIYHWPERMEKEKREGPLRCGGGLTGGRKERGKGDGICLVLGSGQVKELPGD